MPFPGRIFAIANDHEKQPRVRWRGGLLLATSIALVALPVSSSAEAGSGVPNDIEACASKRHAAKPRAGSIAAVVWCAKIASVSTNMTMRWTTCAGSSAAPGERCESGLVNLEFRTRTAAGNWRVKTSRGAQGWHLTNGSGTIACRRDRHDLSAGDPRARRMGRGRFSHIDAFVWPAGASAKVSVGVSQYPNGGIGELSGDSRGACPYWAFIPSITAPNTPPSASFEARRLFTPAPITYTTTFSTSARLPAATMKSQDGPVGSNRIRVTTRSTTTIGFKPRPTAS